ncbi:unnamed protein product, partial [Rotaria magnacalcarata]
MNSVEYSLNNSSNQTENISQITDTVSVYDEIITTTKSFDEKSLKPSISSTTINFPIEELASKIHSLPLIQSEPMLT